MAAQGPSIWFWVGAAGEAPPKVDFWVMSTPLRWTVTAIMVAMLLFT